MGGGMKPTNTDVEAVLRAADEWVRVLEVLVAAQAGCGGTEAEEEDVDVAGCRLVAAVARWRASRGLE